MARSAILILSLVLSVIAAAQECRDDINACFTQTNNAIKTMNDPSASQEEQLKAAQIVTTNYPALQEHQHMVNAAAGPVGNFYEAAGSVSTLNPVDITKAQKLVDKNGSPPQSDSPPKTSGTDTIPQTAIPKTDKENQEAVVPPATVTPEEQKVVLAALDDGPVPGGETPSDATVDQRIQSLPSNDRPAADNILSGQEEALERGGSRDEARYRGLGVRFNALGDAKNALRSLDHAVELNPSDPEALSQRARSKAILGDKEGALADARTTLQVSPHNQLAQIIVGHADSLGQSAGRIKGQKLDFGAGFDPETLNRNRGAQSISVNTSRPGGGSLGSLALAGAQILDIASRGATTPSETFLQKAYKKMQMKDYSGARMDATAAVDADRKSAAALTVRAEIGNQLLDFKSAVRDAIDALKLEPLSAQALRAKAYAEIGDGNFAEAMIDIKRAIELDPGSGVGYLYQAIAEEKMGMRQEALNDYDKADDLDPSLTPLTAEAFKRLGAGYDTATSKPAPLPALGVRALFRGGTAALALALVVLGLAGAVAGKKLTTTAKRLLTQNGSEERTILDAPALTVGTGTILGGTYRVTGELGRGGMGVVYDAFDETLQRRVAIKQLQRDERTTSADMERFLQEARLVAQLKHQRLAEIYTVINEGDLFLVFEYVDGQPLDKLLALNRKLGPDATLKLVADVASALDYAHGRKIIHRDLKPSNVMVGKDGAAKVMDFGIAHQSRTATVLTQTGASGTPPYMAPEQALGSVSKASDLYAMAVMTYEMLTGFRPFEGPDFLEQKLRKVYKSPSSRDSSLPKGLDAFFARAFDPDPTKRPSSGDEFLEALTQACRASQPA